MLSVGTGADPKYKNKTSCIFIQLWLVLAVAGSTPLEAPRNVKLSRALISGLRALPRAQDIQLAPFLLFLNGKPKAESIKCGNHNLSYKVINWFIDNCQTGTDFAPPS